MATQPPPETPAPAPPAQPDAPPPEIGTPGPDIDIPAPQPGGDPGFAQPLGQATSSAVGTDTGEAIGNTDHMRASTGGLAGTSR